MKVLVVCKYFPPAYHAGGPVRTLENLLPELTGRFDLTALTTDRDLGDVPLKGRVSAGWEDRCGARVYRMSKEEENVKGLIRFMRKNEHDVLYLNALFDPLFTGALLVLRKNGTIPWRPIVIAPRGQLDAGAIQFKTPKKRAYLAATRALRLFDGVVWQATSIDEQRRIGKWFPMAAKEDRVLLAENLAKRIDTEVASSWTKKTPGRLRLAFVSRVNRKKNLDLVIDAIASIQGKIELNIHGTRDDDTEYLSTCERKITELPANIVVREHGPADPEEIPGIFAGHDAFFFPTHGENYGHVIIESLGAGCPVLLSDRTPWQGLEESKAGWLVANQNVEKYREILTWLVDMDEAEHRLWREGALAYARRVEERQGEVVERTFRLFERAMEMCK